MTMLDVPYRRQTGRWACGVAAFEMAFRHVRRGPLSRFSQQKSYRQLAEAEPHGSANFRVAADSLVSLATHRRLHAAWGRVSPDIAAMERQIAHFICTARVPLIACQRYDDREPELGHFRVIIGLDRGHVTLHDPCPSAGGAALRWPLARLRDSWRRTGRNVTGGVAIWVSPGALQSPLGPDLPNPWYRLPG